MGNTAKIRHRRRRRREWAAYTAAGIKRAVAEFKRLDDEKIASAPRKEPYRG